MISEVPQVTSDVIALILFFGLALVLLVPCNRLIPLDRRSGSIIAAALSYCSQNLIFRFKESIDLLASIDFSVLVLLTSIMVINYLMVNQLEAKQMMLQLQGYCKSNPSSGFWLVCLISFILSPFLTNDGVCLLLANPVAEMFGSDPELLPLEFAPYFLIALASSSNIGSALTYTGNPQNMIVCGDAIEVLTPMEFLIYQFLPTVLSFLVTIGYIFWCWTASSNNRKPSDIPLAVRNVHGFGDVEEHLGDREVEETIIINSPYPYIVILLAVAMVCLIFADLASIAGVICLSAVAMVLYITYGNHIMNNFTVLSPDKESLRLLELSALTPATRKDKLENMDVFFDKLFASIDYGLLMIFLGLFVVVANVENTGLPHKLWNGIVGSNPFGNFVSIFSICCYVLISSQFLGNVAVIQLAKPNVEVLSNHERRYVWVLLSFVATVGGNLTLAGSAANIIVAEKANKIFPDVFNAKNHFRMCFVVTILSCWVGGLLISAIML